MIVSPRPDLGPPPRLGYIGSRIDRVAGLRSDAAALKKLSDDARARVYVVGGELVVLKAISPTCDPLFAPADARALGPVHESVFLGLIDDAPRFGFRLDPQAIEPLKTRNDLKITDLRSIAVQGLVDAEHLPPLAEAKALLGWHARHSHCPNCGAKTEIVQAGWRRDCPACRCEHFPRTDPVVIMLATHGDACLLGRGKQFPRGFYSALAGFIEPGETIEEAVCRELHEEAGVKAHGVRYYATQPWPFPSSLMIGCFAEAESRDIVLDENELADAKWVARDVVRQVLAGDQSQGFWLPPPIAIAHHLVKTWAEM